MRLKCYNSFLFLLAVANIASVTSAFKLSTGNSNDCSGAGGGFVQVANELSCEAAHDALHEEGLVLFSKYKGALIDDSLPSGCIFLNGGVWFNFDPIGSASIGVTPICEYVGEYVARITPKTVPMRSNEIGCFLHYAVN